MQKSVILSDPAPSGAYALSHLQEDLANLLADIFALYVKTKSFHWHVSGENFSQYHLMLDEQSSQLFAITDVIAERARKLGATTIRSISDIASRQRIADNDGPVPGARAMLLELLADNERLAGELRHIHGLCASFSDLATASLVENWIDEAEGRIWFLRASTEV